MGSADRMCECARAEGQARPSQRAASAAGGRWQHSPSGQAEVRRISRLPAAEPARVLERDAQCDGKAALATLVDERRAPVRPRLRVRVLVVRAEPVVGGEHLPARPLAAHPLALDRAGGVGREHHAVVLVRLVDDPALVVLDEVARQAEVMGGQVGEPVRGHLVRHREHVPQVLDGQAPGVGGLAQEHGRLLLRDQHRGGEVVGLHPLPQEVREVLGRAVAEHEVPERLQQDRPRRVHADGLLLEVDPPVAQVGHGPRGAGQVAHVPDGEPVVAHHRQQHALGQGPAGVPGGGQRGGGLLLDLGEVVAALAHHRPQAGVGLPGFLGRRRRLGPLLAQLAVQRQQVLDHVARHPRADPQVRQAEVAVDRVLLRLLEGDLQLGPAARRLAPQQFRRWHRQRGRQRLDQRQLGLAAAVLDQRQHRGGTADPLAKLGQGQPLGAPGMPEPLAEYAEI